MNLVDPKQTIEVIQKNEFDFKKKFGQNFLIDEHVLDKIIAAGDITKDDVVIEIGPGIGTMTQRLAQCAKKVVAIEIDKNLIPILHETLADYNNVVIINADVMKTDLIELKKEYSPDAPVKVVANLPYYITTPIIMNLFESGLDIKSITVMVQKEVAERMQAGPGNKDYGALSLAVQYYSKPYIAAYVPQNCFIPRPKIGSAVINLERYDKPPVNAADEKMLFAIIRAVFNQRRKTLQNCINNFEELEFRKEDVADALKAMNLDESIRGEALTLEQFAELTNKLYEKKHS